jgi:hypothetical protein
MKGTTLTLCSILAVVIPLSRASAQNRAEPVPAPDRTLLFVDDHHVLYRSGTERVLHPAKRHSDQALIGRTRPWEMAIGWTSNYRDPNTGKYQLWYQAYAGERAESKPMKCVVCYAESDDGVHFTKPEFDFFPFRDTAKTNIVLIANGGYGDRYCNSVIVDPHEKDPARRYKMAYYDWSEIDGREYPGLHVAFSPDGIRWTKHPEGPLNRTLYSGRGAQPVFAGDDPYYETPAKGKPPRRTWQFPLTMSDACDVMYDPARSVFAIYGKFWLDGPDGGAAWKHGMGRSESHDLLHWSDAEFLLGPDDLDLPDTEFHTTPVFHYGGCYFGLNQILDRKAGGTIDIELITSRDGLRWERPFRRNFFLSRTAADTFDGRAIFTNSTPVILDDEIRFYYGAYNQSPVGGVRDEARKSSGVGMARIPRDRFAGIRPVPVSAQATLKKPLEHIGQITMKPLDLSDCREILLNADASQGSVRAELLTAAGYRVRGFTMDDAVPLTGDSLRHRVSWQGRELRELPEGRYLLRLHLDKSTVYAMTLK